MEADKVICLSCTKLDLREHPKHAAVGIGKCSHEKLAGTFVSIAHRRECGSFEQAEAEIINKRNQWWLSITQGEVK